ncbi:MAG: tRNA(Ile)-lysidine synthase [Methanoregulaceae archaeon]|nr:tRNA(Ile)-lysidine synthase [Methanoregulaceae archaeon]
MLCSKCRRPAVIYQRYSGLHLCRTHFDADFEAKAKRAIRVHRWLSSGDRIGVVQRGERESSALLSFLQKLVGRRRDVEVLSLSIDEGIQGYSDTSLARSFAEKRGVWHVDASFREMFGLTFDDISSREDSCQACSSCGTLRALVLERTARELGLTRLAIGVNLDDEARSLFSHFLTGNVKRIIHPPEHRGEPATWIKPFMYIPEQEVALYASYHGEGGIPRLCPYASGGLPADVRGLLDRYSRNHPSTPYALVNLGDRLREHVNAGRSPGQDALLCTGWDGPVICSCSSFHIPDEVADV